MRGLEAIAASLFAPSLVRAHADRNETLVHGMKLGMTTDEVFTFVVEAEKAARATPVGVNYRRIREAMVVHVLRQAGVPERSGITNPPSEDL